MKLHLYIRPGGPLQLGESLSGERAIYLPYTSESDLSRFEADPLFRQLSPAEQDQMRESFPLAVRRYQAFIKGVPHPETYLQRTIRTDHPA